MFGRPNIKFLIPVFLLGFASMIVQITMFREYMVVFSGNELVIGISLFFWMVFTGAGSWLSRYIPQKSLPDKTLPLLIPALCTMAMATVLALFYIRYNYFLPGIILSLSETFFISALSLMPCCLTTGFAFAVMNRKLSLLSGINKTNLSYGIESIGAVSGGLLYFVALAFSVSNIAILKINFIICTLCVLPLIKYRINFVLFALTLIVLTGVILSLTNLDLPKEKILFAGQKILADEDTNFGNLVVTSSQDQVNFYQDGTCSFFTNSIEDNEESVHFAMLQHPHPQKVLVISGGGSGILHEIYKYEVNRIDYVEENPAIIRNVNKYTNNLEQTKELNIIISDARKFLKNPIEKYDVILVYTPEPSTILTNRFFTGQFFSLIKTRLEKDRIFLSFQVSATSGYLSDNKLNRFKHNPQYFKNRV